MTQNRLVIGSRGSKLALWQSHWVQSALQRAHPQLEIELRIIHTTGDKILDTALSRIGDKGLFTKEIEQQLLKGSIDLAVHSLKDLPTALPEGLGIAAVTLREDPADVLVSKDNLTLAQLRPGATVLSGSLRRVAQLLHRRHDIQINDVRGNVQTRLHKLDESDADGIVMAGAGLKRLALQKRIAERLDPADFLPACGQGALAVEVRQADGATTELVSVLNDVESRITTTAERTVLAELKGGCQVPLGAYARIEGDELVLNAMIADLAGVQLLTAHARSPHDQPEQLGREVAAQLFEKGGREILAEIQRQYRSDEPTSE